MGYSVAEIFSELKDANEKDIKSCPFCGGKAEVVYGDCDYNVFQVVCGSCHAMNGWHDNSEDAIAEWEKRLN